MASRTVATTALPWRRRVLEDGRERFEAELARLEKANRTDAELASEQAARRSEETS